MPKLNRIAIFARRWRVVLLLAAFGMALAQSALLDHRIHDLDTAHQVPCKICLLSSGQGAALLPAVPALPAVQATQEAPALPVLPVVLSNARSTTWARAPPV